MSAATSIIAAIDAINVQIKVHQDEIDRLIVARDTIGALVSTDEGKAVRTKFTAKDLKIEVEEGEPIATGRVIVDDDEETADEPAPKATTRGKGRRKMTSQEAGEAFVKSAVKQATRKSTTRGKSSGKQTLADRTTTIRVNSPKGNGKVTRRDQIIALLNKGQSPRQIGDKLGIAPNYVYHVKRSM